MFFFFFFTGKAVQFGNQMFHQVQLAHGATNEAKLYEISCCYQIYAVPLAIKKKQQQQKIMMNLSTKGLIRSTSYGWNNVRRFVLTIVASHQVLHDLQVSSIQLQLQRQPQQQRQLRYYASNKSVGIIKNHSSKDQQQQQQAGGAGTTFYVLDDLSARNPDKLSRYRLKNEIGTGNYAIVREAIDTQTGNRVAIKVMEKAKCGKATCKNEVEILLNLNRTVQHQRLTPVLDVFEDSEKLYIVLELLKGGELYDRVSKKGKLTELEVAQILRKLIYALSALHRHGILHRDIKLENIVMKNAEVEEENSDFKLLDFGFSLAQPNRTAPTPNSDNNSSSNDAANVNKHTKDVVLKGRQTSYHGPLAGTLGSNESKLR